MTTLQATPSPPYSHAYASAHSLHMPVQHTPTTVVSTGSPTGRRKTTKSRGIASYFKPVNATATSTAHVSARKHHPAGAAAALQNVSPQTHQEQPTQPQTMEEVEECPVCKGRFALSAIDVHIAACVTAANPDAGPRQQFGKVSYNIVDAVGELCGSECTICFEEYLPSTPSPILFMLINYCR